MEIGLVGYCCSGKTTIFSAITGIVNPKTAIAEVSVPDARIDTLSAIYEPKKTVYATVRVTDFPGFTSSQRSKGISGEMLQKLKDLDAFCLVVDGFSGQRDPLEDIAAFNQDMIINDLLLVEQRIVAKNKANQRDGELRILEKVHAALSADKPASSVTLSAQEDKLVSQYRFLSRKPVLVIVNQAEGKEANGAEGDLFYLCGTMEKEIAELDPKDQKEFLHDLGLKEPASHRFIRRAYQVLNYISFFTIGRDEVRAWPISQGLTARQAASKIHSDLERGFIRAEVIDYNAFMRYKSETAVKRAGKMRLEGKDYIVLDGDILHVRFNI